LHCHVTTSLLKALADVVNSALGIKEARSRTMKIAALRRARGKSSSSSYGRGQTPSGPTRRSHSGPLLVIDGDSFAHRAYHALPKTIRREDGEGAGAIVGFANFLLRLYDAEQP
jgi:hypothetical protein